MRDANSIVFVVDDDPLICDSVADLLNSAGFVVRTFRSAAEFIRATRPDVSACLILDVYLPGMSGFELQDRLNRDGQNIPIVFITAHADEPARQRALNAGALDLLAKPVRREALFKAIQSAL
jgi:FixJ family two-component response regulator